MLEIKVFKDFICDFRLNDEKEISIISSKDLSQLKSAGYSAEDFFDYLIEYSHSLLHGSRNKINDTYLRQNSAGKVYGSNLAAIGLLKAIISNKGLFNFKTKLFPLRLVLIFESINILYIKS